MSLIKLDCSADYSKSLLANTLGVGITFIAVSKIVDKFARNSVRVQRNERLLSLAGTLVTVITLKSTGLVNRDFSSGCTVFLVLWAVWNSTSPFRRAPVNSPEDTSLIIYSEEFEKMLREGASFPNTVEVMNDLTLSKLPEQAKFPKELIVEKRLTIDGDNLQALSSCVKLVVSDDLLFNNISAPNCISFPQKIKVGKDLVFKNCPSLPLLPQELEVGGNLEFNECPSLVTLPPQIKITNGLRVANCSNFVGIDDSDAFKGNLSFYNCRSLCYIPEKIHKFIRIEQCNAIAELPNNLTIEGGAYFGNCQNIKMGSEGSLKVTGTLSVFDCPSWNGSFRSLEVSGDLSFRSLQNLTELPTRLTLGGTLALPECSNLRSLPNYIETLGRTSSGQTRSIDLTGTGLSQEVLNRLRSAQIEGIQFHISQARTPPTHVFTEIDEALQFWKNTAGEMNCHLPQVSIQGEHKDRILEYLSRLTSTADYKNEGSRPFLATRILEVFSEMEKNSEINKRAIDCFYQGVTSCSDRIILTLEEIELIIRTYHLEKNSSTEIELKEIGKSYYFLEEVNKKAEAHIKTLKWVDEIEVYLAFKIGLQKRFSLPFSTKDMLYRNCAQVTDEQLQAAGDAIVKDFSEAKLEQYLNRWSPWIIHRRRVNVPKYEDIPLETGEYESRCCCISYEETDKAVVYDGAIYNYEDFFKMYIEQGTDANQQPLDISKVTRLEPLNKPS